MIPIVKWTDLELVNKLNNVLKAINASDINCCFKLPIASGEEFFEIKSPDKNKTLASVFNAKEMMVEYIGASFLPQSSQQKLKIKIERKQDHLYDILKVVDIQGYGVPSNETVVHLMCAIIQEFGKSDKGIALSFLPPEYQKFYEARELTLQKMELISSNLIKNTEDYRAKKDQDYDRKVNELNEQIGKQKKELDQDYFKKLDELAKKESDLNSRLKDKEDKLQFKLQEIDDRESKHARRQIREDLKKELQSRNSKFELTLGTRKLRRSIFWFSIVLLFLFGSGSVFCFVETFKMLGEKRSNLEMIVILVKQLLTTVAFGATAIFFIRWNNLWFQQHAQEEFRLKRLELDIDRASWVVEMALEWQELKGGQIPNELIDKLTKNLFNEDTPVQQQELHPADHLASAILGSSAEVKLKSANGSEVCIDRKGLKQLSNKA